MAIAYSYTRLSTERQLKGHGQERQRLAIQSAVSKYGWILSSQTFEDLGVSAWKGVNRESGALSEFIQLARAGRVPSGSVLIVENGDRLSREGVQKALRLLLELLDLGIQVYTLADDKLYSNDSKDAMFDLMQWMLVAQRGYEESLTKSRRIRAAKAKGKELARDGKIISRKCPNWLKVNEDKTEFIVLEAVAEVVRKVFDMYASGISTKPIAIRLNELGIPYFGRTPEWTHTKVRNLLNQRSVVGVMQPLKVVDGKQVPDGDPIKGYYPAIVSEELWATCANLKALKTTPKGRHTEDIEMANLFKGVLKCSCGSGLAMNSSVVKGRRYSSLRCSQLRSSSCKEKNWHYGAFETLALLGLQQIDWSDLTNTQTSDDALQRIKSQRVLLEQEVVDIDKRIKNFIESIGGGYSSEALLTALEKAEELKQLKQSELSSLKASMQDIEIARKARTDSIEEIQQVLEEISNEPDARYKANQIINKNVESITLGSLEQYETLNKLQGAVDDGGKELPLDSGIDSFHGYICIKTKSESKPLMIEVLKDYKQAFIWSDDGKFTELTTNHQKYNYWNRVKTAVA